MATYEAKMKTETVIKTTASNAFDFAVVAYKADTKHFSKPCVVSEHKSQNAARRMATRLLNVNKYTEAVVAEKVA